MAEAIAEKTGKLNKRIWERGGVKEQLLSPGDDVVIPAGISVELNANSEARSWRQAGTTTGVFEQTLGGTGLKADGKILVIEATASLASAMFILASTAAGAAKIELNGKELANALKVNSGKYVQVGAVKGTTIAFKGTTTVWETVEQELAAASELFVEEKATLKANGSTVKGASISLASTGTVEDNASTVWEPTAAGGTFALNGHTLNGTVKLIGKQQVTPGTGGELKKAQINNKGAAAGEGIKVKKGEELVVAAKGLTTNGTVTEPARLESTVAGETAELETSGETTGYLILKDITTPVGVWYLPHGSEEGANVHTVGTTIKFEAEPSETVVKGKASGTLTLTGTSTATVRNVVTGKATGPILLTGTASGTLRAVVSGKATGPVLLTGTSKATTAAVVTAKASGTILLTGTSKGSIAGAIHGKAAGALLLPGTGAATIRARVTGKATGPLILAGTGTGERRSLVTAKATGTLLFTGTAKGAIHANIVGQATGTLILTGTAHAGRAAAPARIRFTNQKATTITTTSQKATGITVENRKETAGSYSRQ